MPASPDVLWHSVRYGESGLWDGPFPSSGHASSTELVQGLADGGSLISVRRT